MLGCGGDKTPVVAWGLCEVRRYRDDLYCLDSICDRPPIDNLSDDMRSDVELPQGLGTGKLFTNNFDSPLTINNGKLFYDSKIVWEEIK